jgi:osmotically-inducible protein OsmY
MNRTQKYTSAIVAVAIIAAVATMVARHPGQTGPKQGQKLSADALGTAPQLSDAAILQAVAQANVDVRPITVRNVGGIVVLRGTADAASSERAIVAVKSLGFSRVANLLQAPLAIDDEGIRRDAERQLANSRSLDGCTLNVSCNNGVLRVSGTVQNELQQDAARLVLRSVRGAKEVHVQLSKL